MSRRRVSNIIIRFYEIIVNRKFVVIHRFGRRATGHQRAVCCGGVEGRKSQSAEEAVSAMTVHCTSSRVTRRRLWHDSGRWRSHVPADTAKKAHRQRTSVDTTGSRPPSAAHAFRWVFSQLTIPRGISCALLCIATPAASPKHPHRALFLFSSVCSESRQVSDSAESCWQNISKHCLSAMCQSPIVWCEGEG